jgi:biotin carboxyl carrier protein
VLAEQPGTVSAVKVAAGDVVQEGDVLVSLDLR